MHATSVLLHSSNIHLTPTTSLNMMLGTIPPNRSRLKAGPPTEPVALRTTPPQPLCSGLNHLFQPAQSGLLNEYFTITTTMDPAALEAISAWIVRAKR